MDRLATVLLIIGGLNWGSVGLFNYDIVAAIFGGPTAVLARIVYTIVGLAAVYEIFRFPGYRSVRYTDTTSRPIDNRLDRAA